MIVQLGGKSPSRAAREMHRAIEALTPRRDGPSLVAIEAAAPRAFKVSRAVAKIERERMRHKVDATVELAGALRDALAGMRHEALASLGLREASRYDTAGLEHIRLDERSLVRAFGPTLKSMYLEGLRSAVAELRSRPRREAKKSPSPPNLEMLVDWDVVPQDALDALDSYALTFSRDVVEREKAALKRMIYTALADGESSYQLADHIREFFGAGIHVLNDAGAIVRTIPEDSWIDMVARTEVARANNAGIMDTYRRANVATVMWLSAEDERTCPVCSDLDGAVVNVGDPFPGTDVSEPPEHPSCRCTVVAGPDHDEEDS